MDVTVAATQRNANTRGYNVDDLQRTYVTRVDAELARALMTSHTCVILTKARTVLAEMGVSAFLGFIEGVNYLGNVSNHHDAKLALQRVILGHSPYTNLGVAE